MSVAISRFHEMPLLKDIDLPSRLSTRVVDEVEMGEEREMVWKEG
jgi:hypothetical protein